jgi:hypothetical protein
MNIEAFDILGKYQPGYLHMQINTDADLKDLNKLASDPATAQYFSTFFHEYIHFLQDITTASGLMRSVYLIDVLKEFIHQVKNDGKSEFKTPLKLTNNSNLEANTTLQKLYRGDDKVIDYIRYSHYTVEFTEVRDKDGTIKNVVQYEITYYSRSGQLGTFIFGSACLMEYVAHAIQYTFAPNTPHPDVPYLVPELVLEKEYPEFGNDPMKIAALCDASMMSFHSAQMFFNLINAMKHQKFVPNKPKDVYEFMHKNFTLHGSDRNYTVDDLFESQLEMALYQLNDALKSDIFEPNRYWVNHIFKEGFALRKAVPDFFTHLVESEGKLSTFYFDIFNRIGSPFITNKNEIGGFIPPRIIDATGIQPYQLLVFREIIMIFYGQRKCGMYNFCKIHAERPIINADCLTEPWKRGVADDLCPLGQFWKTWGLNGEVPII